MISSQAKSHVFSVKKIFLFIKYLLFIFLFFEFCFLEGLEVCWEGYSQSSHLPSAQQICLPQNFQQTSKPADRYQVNVVLFYISARKEMFGKLADRQKVLEAFIYLLDIADQQTNRQKTRTRGSIYLLDIADQQTSRQKTRTRGSIYLLDMRFLADQQTSRQKRRTRSSIYLLDLQVLANTQTDRYKGFLYICQS